MRIAILGTRGVPSGYSGYEAFAEEVGYRLVERGHEVLVYCRTALFQDRPAVYRGMRMLYLPAIQTKSQSTFSHMFLSAIDVLLRKVDVAMVCNVANSPGCAIPKLAGIKTAINVDGLEWLRPKWGKWGKRYFKFSARIAKHTSDVIVTDAEGMRQVYLREFKADSEMIAYGANIQDSEHPEMLAQYGLVPKQYFLIASRLVPDNNADLIIRAFEQVETDKALAIAGGTPYHDSFVERVKATTDPRVRFLGHIDDQAQIRELHCNAYAYIHGHQFGGTNPALLKALGYGNCILALDTVFNREVLGKYGLFFEKTKASLVEKIRYLLENPTVQAHMAKAAPNRIRERYTWDHITDEYERLFLRLCGAALPARLQASQPGQV